MLAADGALFSLIPLHPSGKKLAVDMVKQIILEGSGQLLIVPHLPVAVAVHLVEGGHCAAGSSR